MRPSSASGCLPADVVAVPAAWPTSNPSAADSRTASARAPLPSRRPRPSRHDRLNPIYDWGFMTLLDIRIGGGGVTCSFVPSIG